MKWISLLPVRYVAARRTCWLRAFRCSGSPSALASGCSDGKLQRQSSDCLRCSIA